jgi:hypothetical protein
VTRVLAAVAVALMLVVGVPAAAVASLGQDPDSTIELSATGAAPGGRVTVTLHGWPTGVVEVAICSSAGEATSSATCAIASSLTMSVSPGRIATGTLRVAAPPADCPCEVRARSLDRRTEVAAPLGLRGLVESPARQEGAWSSRPVVVDQVALSGRGLTEQFGLSGNRIVTMRIRNRGSERVSGIALSVAAGKKGSDLEAVDVPDVAPIEPGRSRRVRVPVRFDGPVSGTYVVEVTVSAASVSSMASVDTTVHPWGLVALGAVLVVALAVRLVRLRRGLARRRADDRTDDSAESTLDPLDTTEHGRENPRLEEAAIP